MTAGTPDAPERRADLPDPLEKLREQMRELTDQLEALSGGTAEDGDEHDHDDGVADDDAATAELERAEPTDVTADGAEAAPQDAAEVAGAAKPDLHARLAALEAKEAAEATEAVDVSEAEPDLEDSAPETGEVAAGPEPADAPDEAPEAAPQDGAEVAGAVKPDLHAKLAALEAAEAKLEAGHDTAADLDDPTPAADQPIPSEIKASQDAPESSGAVSEPEDAGPQELEEAPPTDPASTETEADASPDAGALPPTGDESDGPATPVVAAADVEAADPRQRTVAGRQVIVDDDELDQTGVRLEELPTPVAKKRRAPRVLAVVAVVALIAVGLFAVGWWMDQNDTETADETAEAAVTVEPEATRPPAISDSDAGAVPTTAAAAAAVPAEEPAPTESTVASEAPAEPTAEVDPDVVVESATTALADAGYSTISARYDDGTLVVEGVLPSSDLTSGYFSEIDNVTSTVADVPGVDVVASRLFLRGDDERLRKQLDAISRQQPIEFDLGSADLSDDAKAALADASVVILANPGLRVLVAGHTDASGSSQSNAELATARTGAVILELVALGVPITRLQPVTYGELFLDEDATDAENRRVAFEVAP